MSDIRHILEMERRSDGHIRLYRIDKYWIAFECSAFNLFSLCNVDAIIKVRGLKEERSSMLIGIVKNVTPVLYNPQFTILEKTEDKVLMRSRVTCRGFQHWKDGLISLFTDNLYMVPDDTSHNIHLLNLEMLLN